MDNTPQLKEKVLSALEAGKRIKLKWNCGGDEAIVTVILNGEELQYDHPFVQELDMYIVNYLNLPDSGDFEMEGGGEIIREDGTLFIVYESTLLGVSDYESEEGGWKVLNEKDEAFSGKKKLFKE